MVAVCPGAVTAQLLELTVLVSHGWDRKPVKWLGYLDPEAAIPAHSEKHLPLRQPPQLLQMQVLF